MDHDDATTEGADGRSAAGWTPPADAAPPVPAPPASSPAPSGATAAVPPSEWAAFAAPEPPAPRRRWPWVVGAVALVVVGAAVVVAVWANLAQLGRELALGPEPGEGQTWVADMKVGDCYLLDTQERAEGSVGYVAVGPCSTPHDGEVFAIVPLEFDAWPGARVLDDAAEKACSELYGALDEAIYDEESIAPGWYVPDQDSWPDEKHTAQCVVESDQPLGLTRSWRAGVASASASPSA